METETETSPDNELGRVCAMGVPSDCPADHTCQIRGVQNGSTTMGYCSPPCAVDADCGTGYSGPGTVTCFQPDECLIVCDSTCPSGLDCLPTGGPTGVMVCAVGE